MMNLTLPLTIVNVETPTVEPIEVEPVEIPSVEDAEWWAGQNADWHDLGGEPESEPDWDALAEESAATDRLCLGYCL